ncbi:hypothetical protein ACJX0J_037799, partial [Zea mays]
MFFFENLDHINPPLVQYLKLVLLLRLQIILASTIVSLDIINHLLEVVIIIIEIQRFFYFNDRIMFFIHLDHIWATSNTEGQINLLIILYRIQGSCFYSLILVGTSYTHIPASEGIWKGEAKGIFETFYAGEQVVGQESTGGGGGGGGGGDANFFLCTHFFIVHPYEQQHH